MKTTLLSALALLFFSAAQSQILFSEDFDDISGPTAGGAGTYTFPSGWLLRNVDNRTPDAQVAYINEAWERREDFGMNVLDSCAFSTSYYSPAGAADDWMWTPPFTVLPNTSLKWNSRISDPLYPDSYEVRVMAAPSTPTGGTGVIGNQVTNSTVVFSTSSESGAWTAHNVSLGAFAGQTIRVAFRNNANDKFLLLIDDIVAKVETDHDLTVLNGSTGHGSLMVSPADHLTATENFQLKGSIYNNGLQSASNVRLGCDVIVDGILLTSVQSTPVASVASGATIAATIAYTPTINGHYDFKFYPIMTDADQETTNDTITEPLGMDVDPHVMRRDNNQVVGTLGIGGNVGGYIGQTFRFETPVNIASISSYQTRGYGGTKHTTVIYNTDASGVPTTFYAATDTLIYPDDSARLYTYPLSGGTLTLPAGEYAFLQIEFDSTLALAQSSEIFTLNTVYVQWPTNPYGTGFVPVELFPGFSKSLVLYPNFDLCLSANGGTLVDSTQAFCGMNNGAAEVAPDPGYTVLWDDSTTANINSALAAGFHTYTLSNTYCSFTDSVEITNPALPVATVSSVTDAPCFGGNGTINLAIQDGTAPYTVTWSDTVTGPAFSGPAGTYSINVTDANNCQATIPGVTIGEPAQLTATVSNVTDALCFGGNGTIDLAVQDGTAPYTVTWSDTVTGPAFSGPAGTYSIDVTDANNCQATISGVTIGEPAQLTATVSNVTDALCFGGNGTIDLAIQNGVAPITVTWSDTVTGPAFSGPAGTYSVDVTDANNCQATISGVTIGEPAQLTATVSNVTDALCFGGNGTIDLAIQNGVAPITVTWSDTVTGPAFSGPAGTYSVDITDDNNCQTTISSVTIGEPAQLTATVSAITDALCFGGNGTIMIDIQDGTEPYTVTWSDTVTGPAFFGPAGTYFIDVTDDNNCQTTISNVTIGEPAQLTATGTATDETCDSCNDGTASVSISGGTAAYTVNWSNGDTGASVSGLEPGDYTATITDDNGCSTTVDVTVVAFDDEGIAELSSYGISVYPNPVSDFLVVEAKKGNVNSVTLIDATGRTVAELAQTGAAFTADMRFVARGTYQVVIRTNRETVTAKVVKQ